MKEVTGNLLDMAENGKFDVIIQGCNCFNTMGAGIAAQIHNRYPTAFLADYITSKGNPRKLGNYTSSIQYEKDQYLFTIINAYTQFDCDPREIQVDYMAIKKVMRTINKVYRNTRIGIPMIGAGLAGGDWEIISKIIDEELTDVDITLVIYQQ